MNARDPMFLPDVQAAVDARDIAIQRVGVKSMTFPVMVATPRGPQPTVASVDMFVGLPPEQKGTHMSRFIEVLQQHHAPLAPASLRQLMTAMLTRLEAVDGLIEFRFPYFVMKSAPVSGVQSLMDYRARLTAEQKDGRLTLTQAVVVPVTSLCPCSKNVADYGAHNQRSHLSLAVELDGELSIEELLRVAEDAASSEVWGLLKRTDEKYVTERAYDNPKFVEDMVRDIALALGREPRVAAYRVEAENFESIHNHSAYALVEHDKRAGAAGG